jgi:DNA-binding PucR family transcriptional regulator
VHPDLYRLREHDRRNDTRYMQTLFEFLLCGGNYTDTANRLGLHRNSLIYRMSKIREIVAWPLDDAENKKLLLTSFLLLGGDRNK